MARNDAWRRYLETGMAAVNMTRSRAEGIVKDLVKAGELQQGRAQKAVEELMERSRKNSEDIGKLVRHELQQQLASLGIATKEDIARLEAKIQKATAAPKKAPAKKSAAPAANTAQEA